MQIRPQVEGIMVAAAPTAKRQLGAAGAAGGAAGPAATGPMQHRQQVVGGHAGAGRAAGCGEQGALACDGSCARPVLRAAPPRLGPAAERFSYRRTPARRRSENGNEAPAPPG